MIRAQLLASKYALVGLCKAKQALTLLTIIEGQSLMILLKNPSHPGDVLKELYLIPLNLSSITLAQRLHVPRTRIERIVKRETAVSADTAMRLAKFFGTKPEYWLNLQRASDLARAKEVTDVSDIAPHVAA
jgi:antitoxin HigA-1